MKKSEFWEKIWIPITKRLPPDDRKLMVMVWSYRIKEPLIWDSFTARLCAEGALDEWDGMTQDRYISHWCKISPPEKPSETTNEESSESV